jgi:PASTA domain
MNRRIIRMTLGAALIVPLLGAFSSSASANTATMGSQLINDYSGGISGAPVLSVQLSFDPGTSPNPVTSPANGVITGWKVKSADDGALYTLQVLRANGPVSLVTATNSNFSGIASVQAPSAVPAGTGASTPTGVVFSYPASLPISKGDYIGVRVGGTGTNLPQFQANGLPKNLIANNFSGQPTDGQSADMLADEQHELLLQATVKFCSVPALKGLKRGAAEQALAAADCAAGKVTKKKLKPSKKTKKKKGKVLNQSLAPGSTAAPGTPVDLKIAALRKKKH